jgi:hypothetical protein
METTTGGWTVLDRAAGVLAHTYEFTRGATATTFIARMADGTLMVVSPPSALSDAMAEELSAFGEVGALVANNGLHHLGQETWRARYPSARCFAPDAAATRIAKKSKRALRFEPLAALAELAGPDVQVREVPNTHLGESWFSARSGSGNVHYVSDVLANMPQLPGAFVPSLLFRLTKSAPGFSVFHLALRFAVRDKKATLRLLLEDLEASPPSVLVPAHGAILDGPGLAAETDALIRAAL